MKFNPVTMIPYCIKEYFKHSAIYYVKKMGIQIKRRTYSQKKRTWGSKYYSPILYEQEGNDLISDRISAGKPLMVSRLGGIELSCIAYYLRHGGFTNGYTLSPGVRQDVIDLMGQLPGFFPLKDEFLDRFCEQYLDQIPDTDVMAVWYNDYEYVICNKYCPSAQIVDLHCIEPFRYQDPWSYHLKDKRVLVIHPFIESIKNQYSERRKLLWADPAVLPKFELKTIKAVVSIGGKQVPFSTWFDAYEFMCDQITKVDFDIAIIGAGSYGLPLASFVKRIGKQSIHMGGVSQILFGIRGTRWETEYAGIPIFKGNDYWIRPSDTERVENHQRYENGAYW